MILAMEGILFKSVCVVVLSLCFVLNAAEESSTQTNASEPVPDAKVIAQTRRVNRFSTEVLYTISESCEKYDANFVISPFSIWSLMALIAEGASDRSYKQLERVLRLPNNLRNLRSANKNIQRLLAVNDSGIGLSVNQALFPDTKFELEPDYLNTLENFYEADHVSVDFRNAENASHAINEFVSNRTQGEIGSVVKSDDLTDTQLILLSTIIFKGQWRYPFDETQTINLPFYRENGALVADVPMMTQLSMLRTASIPPLKATFIELPYGNNNRFSMLLIYPHSTLNAVFQGLRNFDIGSIHRALPTDEDEYDEVILTFPKFKIDSDLDMQHVFKHLGVTDIFEPNEANLSIMSKNPLYVSRVLHKAIIDVNEVGTIASAVTAAQLNFRTIAQEFVFNRPFGFLITDQTTNSLLFAGQVRYPLS